MLTPLLRRLLFLSIGLLTGCGAVIDQVRTDTDDEVLATLGGEPNILAMDDTADSFGVTSAGAGQIRGNGCLAATADGLRRNASGSRARAF
jgi:hypothetical protein